MNIVEKSLARLLDRASLQVNLSGRERCELREFFYSFSGNEPPTAGAKKAAFEFLKSINMCKQDSYNDFVLEHYDNLGFCVR